MVKIRTEASRPDRDRERKSKANGPVTTYKLSREEMDAYFESIKDKIPKFDNTPIVPGKMVPKRRKR